MGFTRPGWLSSHPLLSGLKRLVHFCAGALVFLAAFYIYLQVKSGWSVNLAAALAYQKMFYVSGFGMLPIPAFPDLWSIAAIVIVTGLLAAMAGVSGGSDQMLERASYLAVLSIGIFLYYTGRSHWLVLRFVVWPEVILFFYLADQSVAASRAGVKFVTIGVAVFLPLAATVFFFSAWSTVVAGMWKPAPGHNLVEQDISFLRSLTVPGESIAIIAENEATLYASSGTWPSRRGPSLAELQLVKDRDALMHDVARAGSKKLFINAAPISIPFSTSWIDQQSLQSHYELRATGPGGRLLYFVRRD